MTEFAQGSAIQLVAHNWARINPAERATLLKVLAQLFPDTYDRFEEPHFKDLAHRSNTSALPLNVQGHLFMAVTPDGFSKDQVITILDDAANSFQG